MPKVSTIISIYRPNEVYLREQLESIDAQDFSDMDVIVYNDCPDDRDWRGFCERHCTRHPLRYVQGEHNLGYVKAFEKLVGIADGDYLVLCDQDDRWLPGRVSAGVAALDAGYLLVLCDRQIIDGDGVVTNPSWRKSHPHDRSVTWANGEHFADRAAFACYSIGMATMLRVDVARDLRPYPTCTGHDKWLALGANTLGPCANLDQALVQYRQHGGNVTGTMTGIESKEDWRRRRVEDTYELAREYASRFPDSPDISAIMGFAKARMEGDVGRIWHYRYLAPKVATFEVALHLTPDCMVGGLLRLVRTMG